MTDTPQPSAQGAQSVETVAWRIRHRSEPGMIGHYPWTYTERKTAIKYLQPTSEYEGLVRLSDYEALAAERAALRAAVQRVIPTSWFDPLLTGPDAVIPSGAKITGLHIEALMRALEARLNAALATTEGGKG